MKVWFPLLVCAVILGAVCSCKKSSNSPIPYIELISLSPDSIKGRSAVDTIYLTFSFADGDGDLGNDITQGSYDVYLEDSRDTIFNQRYAFPDIPDDAVSPVDGLKGKGAIALLGLNFVPRQDTIHKFRGDTLTLSMYILDRAKHKSNVITTPPIYIRP